MEAKNQCTKKLTNLEDPPQPKEHLKGRTHMIFFNGAIFD